MANVGGTGGKHLLHLGGGALVGWLILGMLLWLDVANLGQLVAASEPWFLPVLMLGFAFGATFGVASFATGLAWQEQNDRFRPREGPPLVPWAALPAPASRNLSLQDPAPWS